MEGKDLLNREPQFRIWVFLGERGVRE